MHRNIHGPTKAQKRAVDTLVKQVHLSGPSLQALLESGILADLLKARFLGKQIEVLNNQELKNLRNQMRIILGHEVQKMPFCFRRSTFTKSIDGNGYAKIQNARALKIISDHDYGSHSVDEWRYVSTVQTDNWSNQEEVTKLLKEQKLRIATPLELSLFDGVYPFASRAVPLSVFIPDIQELPGAEMVIWCDVSGRRIVSFYPSFFPAKKGLRRILVIHTEIAPV
jgi:hypothetical protein